MAVFLLESLVLRGVAVLRDGSGVGLRLGAGCKTKPGAPSVTISMRRPLPNPWGFDQPAGRHTYVSCAANRAGRPQGSEVASRRSPARNPGRAILSRWSPSRTPPVSTMGKGDR